MPNVSTTAALAACLSLTPCALRGADVPDPSTPPASAGEAVSSAQEAAASLRQARQLAAEQRWEESNAAYSRYLEQLPPVPAPVDLRRSRAHRFMARNWLGMGEPTRALECLRQAVDHGMWQVQLISSDPEIAPLRETEGYRELLDYCRSAPARMAVGLRTIDGKTIDAKDLDGKVLILDVWGTWCPPCRGEIPHFVELQEKYGDKGLQVIGITFEKTRPTEAVRASVERFTQAANVNYPCALVDAEFVGNIPVDRFPTTFFIGHDGKVARRIEGAYGLQSLETWAVELLNAKIRADYEAKKKAARKQAEAEAAAKEAEQDAAKVAPPPEGR